ncbi:MAG: glycosyltransferase family 2 protein [Candidatus Margulisiibacteriota bacterium]|nr:glycosyltransferase family 2 protein [Candidatus Margulisiibacteriota bacterium]
MRPFCINIPIYNEEAILVKNIERLIDFLDKLKTDYEIIIVSNGSTDKSILLGEGLQDKHSRVKFFSLPKKGVGRAFRTAVEAAKYGHIISLDADLSVDLSFIKEANTLLENNVMVIGSKIMGSQKRSFMRKIGSGIYIYFTKLFFRVSLHDFSIGAKGFQRGFVLKNIEAIDQHTSYVLNLAHAATREGEKVTEIPIKCIDLRRSRFNLLTEALYRFSMLFKLALRKK